MADPPPHARLFHLVQVPLWRAAAAGAGAAADAADADAAATTPKPGVYYPPTYEQDGFTHLTADPSLLLGVANQFYRDVPADVEWRVLVLDAAKLAAAEGAGPIRYEPAAPVGSIAARKGEETLLYPHLYGGIPTICEGVVLAELPVVREPGEGGAFLKFVGLGEWAE